MLETTIILIFAILESQLCSINTAMLQDSSPGILKIFPNTTKGRFTPLTIPANKLPTS